MLKLMSPTMSTNGGIGLEICVRSKRPERLNVALGLSSLGWGQESRRSRSTSLLFLVMVMKAVIDGAPDGY